MFYWSKNEIFSLQAENTVFGHVLVLWRFGDPSRLIQHTILRLATKNQSRFTSVIVVSKQEYFFFHYKREILYLAIFSFSDALGTLLDRFSTQFLAGIPKIGAKQFWVVFGNFPISHTRDHSSRILEITRILKIKSICTTLSLSDLF